MNQDDHYTPEEREAFGCPKPPPRKKKKPQPLTRKPIVKKPYQWKSKKGYKIKQQSEKQKRKRLQVAKAVLNKLENGTLACQSCMRSDNPLDPSHLLPQGQYPELAAEANNIHWHCRTPCHDDCETMKFYKMRDGLEILEYMWTNEPEPKRKFWKALGKYDGLNFQLWQQSTLYDKSVHGETFL